MQEQSANTPDPKPLLTSRDVCRLLSISRTTLDRHVRRGFLPRPIRIGRGKSAIRRWRAAEIHAFMNDDTAADPDPDPDPAGEAA